MRKLFLVPVSFVLAVTFTLPSGQPSNAAPTAAGDRITSLPQTTGNSGAHIENVLVDRNMGYTVTLKQFKKALVAPSVRRKLASNDTVLRFDIRWRHGERAFFGLLHAFRHGSQVHLSVHQKVYFSDRTDPKSVAHPTMTPFDLEGTVYGVRKDAKGFLIGNRMRVDFQGKLSGDIFGTRMILSGTLAVRRIGV